MCGIAGFCNEKLNQREIIAAMTERMRHRGPDAGGYWIDEQSGWVIGHRRLSIVDLSDKGAQPMHSASGRYVISFNGEIYNAAKLEGKTSEEWVCHPLPGIF